MRRSPHPLQRPPHGPEQLRGDREVERLDDSIADESRPPAPRDLPLERSPATYSTLAETRLGARTNGIATGRERTPQPVVGKRASGVQAFVCLANARTERPAWRKPARTRLLLASRRVGSLQCLVRPCALATMLVHHAGVRSLSALESGGISHTSM